MKISYLLPLIFVTWFCQLSPAQNSKKTVNLYTQTLIPTPKGYKKLKEVKGDLNKDTKEEIVVVYDTGKPTEDGTERILCVYQQIAGKWVLWQKSKTAVLASEHGGRFGDAFEGIEISRGCIVVFHTGGGRPMWSYTHRFRFNTDKFYLIGATIYFGNPCDSFSTYDYNLLTGKIEGSIETEKCDDSDKVLGSTKEKFTFSAGRKTNHAMDKFVPGETEVKVPGREEFYY